MQQRRDKEVDYHNLLCLLVLHCDWSILQAIFQCTANLNQKFNGSEFPPLFEPRVKMNIFLA